MSSLLNSITLFVVPKANIGVRFNSHLTIYKGNTAAGKVM